MSMFALYKGRNSQNFTVDYVSLNGILLQTYPDLQSRVPKQVVSVCCLATTRGIWLDLGKVVKANPQCHDSPLPVPSADSVYIGAALPTTRFRH